MLWVLLNFFPIGWSQLAAVYEHGLAYARSVTFYDTTLVWQWMRLPGDVVFAAGAVLIAWDFYLSRRVRFCRAQSCAGSRAPVDREPVRGCR